MADSFIPPFPVILYHDDLELPNQGTYFLVAGNGVWLHKDTGIVRALLPVKNISILPDFETEKIIECRLPKLSASEVAKIKQFFKAVVTKHHAEAAVILYFDKDKNECFVDAPEQHVSGVSVNYSRIPIQQENVLQVGTIHSHCDFNAFHSGTDVDDEHDFDGLHCTFGHNDKDEFSIVASIAVNGFRETVNPLDYLEGIEHIDGRYKLIDPSVNEAAVSVWLNRVNDLPIRFSYKDKNDQKI